MSFILIDCKCKSNGDRKQIILREIMKKNKNSGESIESAIPVKNVPAEYYHLFKTFGSPIEDWKLLRQSFMFKNKRSYDRIDIKLNSGSKKTVYFDITGFMTKQ